ncbi:MAG: CapA family protein [Oscillospiraceae bacterium]|nr:CapA family protein [Oscillospiraceae bacterium]
MKKLLLAILAGLAALLVALTLVFVLNTNNDDTPRNYVPHATTEPATEPPAEPVNIRIQFAGDALMHSGPIGAARTGQNTAGYNTYDFRPFLRDIAPFIRAGDLNIINMETPVDAYGNNTRITTWPRFNVPFEVLEALDYAGFDHLIFANNHTVDRGFSGMVATIENFRRAGLAHTGAYESEAAFNTPTVIDVNGIQVGIVAYTESLNGLDSLLTPHQHTFAVRRFNFYDVTNGIPAMVADMNNLRAHGAEIVIVSIHWGAEYVNQPTVAQVRFARALAEAGADIIMGHHSHTPMPIEWHYREDGTRGLIIYSLGNFLADQTRLNPPDSRTQYTKLVTANIRRYPDGTTVMGEAEVLPAYIMRDRTGNTLGAPDRIAILPIIGGELPDFVQAGYLRQRGRNAHAHLLRITGGFDGQPFAPVIPR